MKAVVFLVLLLITSSGYAQSEKARYYLHQSQIYLEEEKFNKAEQFADSVLMTAAQSNNLDSLGSAYRWLYEVHVAKKDYQKALQDFKMATRYTDSVKVLKQKAIEEDLRTNLLQEKEARAKETATLNNEIKSLHETADRNWRNTLIVIGATFVLSLILVLILFRRKNQLQVELEKAMGDLQHLQLFKAKLFTVLSYDLRNSLSRFENLTHGLAGQLNTLNKDESVQFLTNLHLTAGDLKSTLHNVIHWIAYQANAKPFHPELFDCKVVTEQVIEKFRLQFSNKKLTANIFIPDTQVVYADKEMIEIILENLISNAIHFTSTGGVITCFSGRKDNLVTICIKDTGVGISEDNISKLFDAKEDFHSIGKPGNKGAGVSLILCKDLVERNGGRIYVESAVGQGSTFYFTLPEKSV